MNQFQALRQPYDPANLVGYTSSGNWNCKPHSDWFGLSPSSGAAFEIQAGTNKSLHLVLHRWLDGYESPAELLRWNEEMITWDAISLAETIIGSAGAFDKAYLVLGGEGWTLRDYYVSGGLAKHLMHADKVKIVTLEGFVALANRGKL